MSSGYVYAANPTICSGRLWRPDPAPMWFSEVSFSTADTGSGRPGFAGVWRANFGGVFVTASKPFAACLIGLRPSPELSGTDEIEFFLIGGSMKRADASRGVHGLAERRRGRSSATDAARPTGLWLSYRRDGQPLTRSSAPDDDIPQIASAFGLLDPRPITHHSVAD